MHLLYSHIDAHIHSMKNMLLHFETESRFAVQCDMHSHETHEDLPEAQEFSEDLFTRLGSDSPDHITPTGKCRMTNQHKDDPDNLERGGGVGKSMLEFKGTLMCFWI